MNFASGDDKDFEPSTSSSTQWLQPCRHMDFSEILTATENFDESLVIGSGGFGKVYRGSIIDGENLVVAAVKRLDPESSQGPTEFWAEVNMLSVLRHSNIVSLIGYCHHNIEKILVYEYMPNGTLDDHLHKHCTPLSWLLRLNICIDSGCGLRYLHNETGVDSGVIHRDVKSSNILLHKSWAAKISDFGLSKTCPTNQPSTYVKTRVKGSYGYFDPSYYQTGMLTRKSDVYAFGVVLLEVLCRKRAVDSTLGEDQWGLVPWAQDSIKEGKLKHIIDSDIRGEISPKCLKEFVKLANRCLQTNPKQRPTMVEVVVSLENARNLQKRFSSSLRPTRTRTIFGRMADMLLFPSNGENHENIITVRSDNNMLPVIKEVPADSQNPSVKAFSFDDLEKATRNFSRDMLLGKGAYANVFLGWVDQNTLAPSKHGDAIAVAVKRLDEENCQAIVEWQTEANILEQLAHPNIIRLLGRYKDRREHLLVYEYMPNKSFDRFLFKDAFHIARPLSWGTRLLIMIGVARGLTYLHLIKQIIHCDLAATNILLDEDFNAKLGGFGLATTIPETQEAHVTTLVPGTFGYLDPEYFKTGLLTMKSDVYGFGVLLLESITGRRAWDANVFEAQNYLVDWATDQVQTNRRSVKEIMDPRLEDSYPVQSASECFELALRCVAEASNDRPSSEEVLHSLEQIYAQSLQIMEGELDT